MLSRSFEPRLRSARDLFCLGARPSLASRQAARKARADAAEQVLRRWLDRVDISRLRTNRSMQGDWSGRSVDEGGLQAVSGSSSLDIGIAFEGYDRFRREVAEHVIALRD